MCLVLKQCKDKECFKVKANFFNYFLISYTIHYQSLRINVSKYSVINIKISLKNRLVFAHFYNFVKSTALNLPLSLYCGVKYRK
jgi:hypothetical protein